MIEQLTLNFPATVIPTGRADGAVLVVPGKPIVMERELSTKEVAALTGYSVRRIQEMAKELRAGQRRRRCKLRIPASAVARMMEQRC